MPIDDCPRVHFQFEFDERFAAEVRSRGWLDGVTVALKNGRVIPVSFYDPIRLGQDLREETRLGRPFIAEKNMIVLNEITLDAIQKSINHLVNAGFFD